ncbi:MAG: methyltransferase domain-containing protein [Longimicrobiales bacterium]
MNDDSEWFANEAFWAWSFPLMFPARRWEQAAEEVGQVLELTGTEGGRVLDLACGPGRHSVELAARGFEVTGVDRSASLLDHARRRGEDRSVEVEWVEEDMRVFSRPGSYDLAMSIFTSFGYFERHEENVRVLENVHGCLAPGGRFVIHVLGREPLARRFEPTDFTEFDDGRILVQHREVLDDWTRLRATWLLVDGATAERFGFTVWIYSGSELRSMLDAAGFESVQLYGALDGRPYDLDARRLVAVARKPS